MAKNHCYETKKEKKTNLYDSLEKKKQHLETERHCLKKWGRRWSSLL